MDQNDQNELDSTEEPANRPIWIIGAGFVVVALLLLVGLFLPPVSLGERLGLSGSTTTETAETPADSVSVTSDELQATTASEAVTMPEGVALSLPGGEEVAVEALSAAALAASSDSFLASAGAALPTSAAVIGDLYTLSYDGESPAGQIALPLPADAGSPEALDLLGWNGTEWVFIPGQIDAAAQKAVVEEGPLPSVLALVRTAAPDEPSLGLVLDSDIQVPQEVGALIDELAAGELMLSAGGVLDGEVAPAAGNQFLRASNRAGVIDQAALTALLDNIAAQNAQIDTLVQQAAAKGYSGVHLDYQGVGEPKQAAFTAFIESLGAALDAENLDLVLTLGTPTATSTSWDTGGQDWDALGKLADLIYVEMPLAPQAYDEDGTARQLMDWATSQIDRRKLSALLTAGAVARVGEFFAELDEEEILNSFGELQLAESDSQVEPGDTVDFLLDGSASPLEWDGDALSYRFDFEQAGQPRTVWLGSEADLVNRLEVLKGLNLRGISLTGLDDLVSDAGLAAVLNSWLGQGETPQPGGAAIAWTVKDQEDSVVASLTGEELSFNWETAELPGVYEVSADLIVGDRVTSLGTVTLDVGEPEVAEAEITEDTEEGDSEAEEATVPEGGEESAPETAPAPTAPELAGGDPLGQVGIGVNVRTGPGLTYGTISGGVGPGVTFDLIGRNADSSWLNVLLPGDQEGWIFAQLVTPSTDFSVASLEVKEVAPPSVAADPGDGESAPPPANVPPPPPAVGNVGNFELGGQSAGMPAGIMQYAGMTWVKKQHKWHPGDPPEAVAGLINDAHAAGMKILLSIPGQLNPSSIDYNAYVEFLGGVAALGPDAIEVWNEMNIDREWPAGQIDPASYVNNMLKPAYAKIKASNPNVMVITGAPAPTGYFGGCGGGGCDDAPYVAGMMAAGAGGASDCVGVHYNEGLMPPAATSGDPRGAGGHYTRYFQGMINAYAAAGASRLCFTEIGYLSGEEWGSVPSGFLWKAPYNLTVAEHAQYLGEAVRVAVNSGLVRLMVVFNVDFTHWSADPQAGYAIIRPDGSCPACETLRSVMGR